MTSYPCGVLDPIGRESIFRRACSFHFAFAETSDPTVSSLRLDWNQTQKVTLYRTIILHRVLIAIHRCLRACCRDLPSVVVLLTSIGWTSEVVNWNSISTRFRRRIQTNHEDAKEKGRREIG